MNVAIIIPARNEELALAKVLSEIPRELVSEVIVVDNGSRDKTALIAKEGGARVVHEPAPGYGRACLAGLRALDDQIDTIAFLDADHSDYPEELAKLLEPIQQGYADLVVGSRLLLAQRGSLTIVQRFGNQLACTLMYRLFGYQYSDLGPFRVIRRSVIDSLHMQDQTYGWTVEMQAKAAKRGLRVIEIPVGYRRRIGQSKISGTIKGSIKAGSKILWTIGVVALRYSGAPKRVALEITNKDSRETLTHIR